MASLVKKSKEKYFEKIALQSSSKNHNTRRVIDLFDEYVEKHLKLHKDGDIHENLISDLRSMNVNEQIEDTCEILQGVVNFMSKEKGLSGKTVSNYFTMLRSYLYYRGIRLSSQDVSQSILFPPEMREERFPLEHDVIQKLLDVAPYKKRILYLSLASSGMRIGEALRLRKRDMEIVSERVRIRIPAHITKTKMGRTTYISKEASLLVIPRLNQILDEDLVLSSTEKTRSAIIVESKALQIYLTKIGMGQKYNSGRGMITLHSFRAFFFTRAARAHDENYAHMMIGHGGYLMQYDRLTEKEKLDMYIRMEPDLLIRDQSRNEQKIADLTKKNSRLVEDIDKILKQYGDTMHIIEERLKAIEKKL